MLLYISDNMERIPTEIGLYLFISKTVTLTFYFIFFSFTSSYTKDDGGLRVDQMSVMISPQSMIRQRQ